MFYRSGRLLDPFNDSNSWVGDIAPLPPNVPTPIVNKFRKLA